MNNSLLNYFRRVDNILIQFYSITSICIFQQIYFRISIKSPKVSLKLLEQDSNKGTQTAVISEWKNISRIPMRF